MPAVRVFTFGSGNSSCLARSSSVVESCPTAPPLIHASPDWRMLYIIFSIEQATHAVMLLNILFYLHFTTLILN